MAPISISPPWLANHDILNTPTFGKDCKALFKKTFPHDCGNCLQNYDDDQHHDGNSLAYLDEREDDSFIDWRKG